jgi:hypothetical protein
LAISEGDGPAHDKKKRKNKTNRTSTNFNSISLLAFNREPASPSDEEIILIKITIF